MKTLSVNYVCIILKIVNLGFLSNHETLDFVNIGCFNQTTLNITLFHCFADLRKSWNEVNVNLAVVLNRYPNLLAVLPSAWFPGHLSLGFGRERAGQVEDWG